MELSEFFGFVSIFKESIKLVPRSWKFMASITTISLILASIFLFLLNKLFQFMVPIMIKNGPSSQFTHTPLLIIAEVAFLLIFLRSSHFLSLATIHVSAMAYLGKKISLQTLFSNVEGTRRNPENRCLHETRKSSIHVVLLAVFIYMLAIAHLINRVTICALIFVTAAYALCTIYTTTVQAMAIVAAVVEENCEGKIALEKARHLVEGHKGYGFVVNLVDRLLMLIAFAAFWMMKMDKRVSNVKICVAFLVYAHSLLKILRWMGCTVLYFQCKKHHGEEVKIVGDGDQDYVKLLV